MEDINAGSNKGEHPDNTPQKKKAGEDDKECSANSKHCQSEGEPVDMATGYVVDWRTDFTLGGLLSLVMKRYYRSGGERKPGLLGGVVAQQLGHEPDAEKRCRHPDRR
ncbi:hypothetical protein DZS_50080 [Dickeya ananatis]